MTTSTIELKKKMVFVSLFSFHHSLIFVCVRARLLAGRLDVTINAIFSLCMRARGRVFVRQCVCMCKAKRLEICKHISNIFIY